MNRNLFIFWETENNFKYLKNTGYLWYVIIQRLIFPKKMTKPMKTALCSWHKSNSTVLLGIVKFNTDIFNTTFYKSLPLKEL